MAAQVLTPPSEKEVVRRVLWYSWTERAGWYVGGEKERKRGRGQGRGREGSCASCVVILLDKEGRGEGGKEVVRHVL